MFTCPLKQTSTNLGGKRIFLVRCISATLPQHLLAGIDELFVYLFAALDREFTGKQATAVTYLIRLLGSIEGATIRTLLEVMQEPAKSVEQSKYASAIAKRKRYPLSARK